MTPGEIYECKRANFKTKTLRYFEFLCTELGYNEPKLTEGIQGNGVVIQDKFTYSGPQPTVIILNAYHPVDYGFEIRISYNNEPEKYCNQKMIHYVPKENQDMEQTYLEQAAQILKTYLAES